MVAEDMGNDGGDVLDIDCTDDITGQAFLGNAFTISGCHHLLSSVAKDAASALEDHERYYSMLQVEERLLGRTGRREKYIASCLLGTPDADLKKIFKRFSPNLLVVCLGLLVSLETASNVCVPVINSSLSIPSPDEV